MKAASAVKWVVLTLFVLGGFWIYANQQAISDWWVLRNYQPTPEIAALTEDAHLSNRGQDLFYVSDPQLLDKSVFVDSCDFNEFNIVVGCYNGQQIYVLDITKKDLEGGEIVTAAHEMLHAAFDRLGSSEREEIEGWLLAYENQVAEEHVRDTMQLYKDSIDGHAYVNELHSLFGTEVAELSPDLENYYLQYFNDRAALVEVAHAYDKIFQDLETDVDRVTDQLDGLAADLNQTSRLLESRFGQLEAQRSSLQSRIDSGENSQDLINDIDRFQGDIAAYNRRVEEYRQDTKSYNELIEQYEVLVLRHEELIRSIDSNYNPQEISD